MKSKPKLL